VLFRSQLNRGGHDPQKVYAAYSVACTEQKRDATTPLERLSICPQL